MSETPDLLARPTLRPDATAERRPEWLSGLVAAGWALGIGLVLLGTPAIVVWADDGATAPVAGTLGTAVDLWLVAHGAGITVAGTGVGLVPWGLALLLLLLLHRGGRWAAAAARVGSTRGVLIVLAAGAGAYAAVAGVLAVVAARPDVSVAPWRAVLAAAAIAVLGLGTGVLRESGLAPDVVRGLPQRVRRALVGGAVGAATVLAGGAVLVLASLVLHLGRVHGLLADLGAGAVGGAVLTLVGAALLPNAAVWAAAVALGPGFAVGAGTSFGTGSVRLGALPALPVLGALPSTLPTPVGAAVLLVPVAAGAFTAWALHRRRRAAASSDRLWSVLLDAAAAGLVAGGLLGLAALLSGGSAGSEHLAVVGPGAWQMAAAGAAEVGLAALLAALALHWRLRSRTTTDAVPDAVPEPSGVRAGG